ncbi:MAG: YdcF family protein [Desulfobacca sp.]|uniref:YdcF family protein n=1 Tax=Desulfobacca sp. TaxID=2067990 RepID=UPI0040495297
MPDMFFLKKIVGYLSTPGTVILVLLLLGLRRLLKADKLHRAGLPWFLLATICFYLFTTAPLATALLAPLERYYAPLTASADLSAVRFLVILSGGQRYAGDVPATSRLDAVTAARVVEGIRLYHLCAGQPTLIMSGGGDSRVGAQMVAFAQALGIPSDKLLAETNSLDTHGNAREVKALVRQEPFILVTSAAHLPRAMAIFQKLGMQPIPAPADFRGRAAYRWSDFLPSGDAFQDLDAALHEYLGLAYLKLWPDRAGR